MTFKVIHLLHALVIFTSPQSGGTKSYNKT